MLWAHKGGDACSEVRTSFLDEFPHVAEALHTLWLCPSQNSLAGKGPCKGSNPASAESRVNGGTRAEAWDFVHTGVEILCDRGEGPVAVLTCSSGRRLAPWGKFYHQHGVEQFQNMSHIHTHPPKNGEEFLAEGEGCHMYFSLFLTSPLSPDQIMCKYWL